MTTDITEPKRSEKWLRGAKERLEYVVSHNPAVIAESRKAESDPRIVALLKSFSEIMSVVLILVGSLVLVGWKYDITVLKSLSPTLVSMKANTAICFVLSGISLWLLQTKRVNRAHGLRIAEVCGLIVAAVGFLSMVEYWFGLDLGIDQLVFIEPPGAVWTVYPGRMALTTAFNFSIVGIALLLLGEQRYLSSQLIVLIEDVVAFLAVVGYMYGVTGLYKIPWQYTPMAIHTAVMFLLIAGSVLFAHSDEGIMSVLTSTLPGGANVRRLLPALLTVTIVGGWVCLQGERAGYYGTEYVVSLLAIFATTMLTSLTWFNARSLNRTERVRIQAEEKLHGMREQFLSHVTHELRTPLGPLKVHLDYAVAGKLGAVSQKLESSLQVMKRSTDRLHQLTNELLDVRRIQAGKLQLNPERLNFREVLEQSIKEIEVVADQKKQRVHLEVSNEPLPVRGDPGRLGQVLANLLDNASKYTPEQGEITITVNADADTIRLILSDTGVGIRKEDLAKVFEPFSNIKKPSTIQSAGLGLSIAKGIVEAHGGKMWVQSDGEGKGATFTFTLPKLKEES
jgi:signal transduction histidine kinase